MYRKEPITKPCYSKDILIASPLALHYVEAPLN